MTSRSCHCGGESFETCCRPYLRAESLPPTAEATMRSRYSAYVVGAGDHLFRTWHPSTRPEIQVSADDGWRGLEIVDVVDGLASDETGMVEFIARHRDGDMRERSMFKRRGGRWMYVAQVVAPCDIDTAKPISAKPDLDQA